MKAFRLMEDQTMADQVKQTDNATEDSIPASENGALEGAELLPDDADGVAGAGQAWNHNQGAA